MTMTSMDTQLISQSINNLFAYRTVKTRWNIKQKFKQDSKNGHWQMPE